MVLFLRLLHLELNNVSSLSQLSDMRRPLRFVRDLKTPRPDINSPAKIAEKLTPDEVNNVGGVLDSTVDWALLGIKLLCDWSLQASEHMRTTCLNSLEKLLLNGISNMTYFTEISRCVAEEYDGGADNEPVKLDREVELTLSFKRLQLLKIIISNMEMAQKLPIDVLWRYLRLTDRHLPTDPILAESTMKALFYLVFSVNDKQHSVRASNAGASADIDLNHRSWENLRIRFLVYAADMLGQSRPTQQDLLPLTPSRPTRVPVGVKLAHPLIDAEVKEFSDAKKAVSAQRDQTPNAIELGYRLLYESITIGADNFRTSPKLLELLNVYVVRKVWQCNLDHASFSTLTSFLRFLIPLLTDMCNPVHYQLFINTYMIRNTLMINATPAPSRLRPRLSDADAQITVTEKQEIVSRALNQILTSLGMRSIIDLFENFDCDPHRTPLIRRIAKACVANATPIFKGVSVSTNNSEGPDNSTVDDSATTAFTEMPSPNNPRVWRSISIRQGGRNINGRFRVSYARVCAIQKASIDVMHNMSGSLYNTLRVWDLRDLSSETAAEAKAGWSERLRQDLLVEKFGQINASKSADFFVKENVCKSSTDFSRVAEFLLTTPGLDLVKVGEILGAKGAWHQSVLDAFLSLFEFKGLSLVNGLRLFFGAFKLPGEGQMIDRILDRFGKSFFLVQDLALGQPITPQSTDPNEPELTDDERTPRLVLNENGSSKTIFKTSDVVFLLSFATVMLNTDLHHPDTKVKMSIDNFLGNTYRINDLQTLNSLYLRSIYHTIRERGLAIGSTMQRQSDQIGLYPTELECIDLHTLASAGKCDNIRCSPSRSSSCATASFDAAQSSSCPAPTCSCSDLFTHDIWSHQDREMAKYAALEIWCDGAHWDVLVSVMSNCCDIVYFEKCLHAVKHWAYIWTAFDEKENLLIMLTDLVAFLQPVLSYKCQALIPIILLTLRQTAPLLYNLDVFNRLAVEFYDFIHLVGLRPRLTMLSSAPHQFSTAQICAVKRIGENAEQSSYSDAVGAPTSHLRRYEALEKAASLGNKMGSTWLSDLASMFFTNSKQNLVADDNVVIGAVNSIPPGAVRNSRLICLSSDGSTVEPGVTQDSVREYTDAARSLWNNTLGLKRLSFELEPTGSSYAADMLAWYEKALALTCGPNLLMYIYGETLPGDEMTLFQLIDKIITHNPVGKSTDYKSVSSRSASMNSIQHRFNMRRDPAPLLSWTSEFDSDGRILCRQFLVLDAFEFSCSQERHVQISCLDYIENHFLHSAKFHKQIIHTFALERVFPSLKVDRQPSTAEDAERTKQETSTASIMESDDARLYTPGLVQVIATLLLNWPEMRTKEPDDQDEFIKSVRIRLLRLLLGVSTLDEATCVVAAFLAIDSLLALAAKPAHDFAPFTLVDLNIGDAGPMPSLPLILMTFTHRLSPVYVDRALSSMPMDSVAVIFDALGRSSLLLLQALTGAGFASTVAHVYKTSPTNTVPSPDIAIGMTRSTFTNTSWPATSLRYLIQCYIFVVWQMLPLFCDTLPDPNLNQFEPEEIYDSAEDVVAAEAWLGSSGESEDLLNILVKKFYDSLISLGIDDAAKMEVWRVFCQLLTCMISFGTRRERRSAMLQMSLHLNRLPISNLPNWFEVIEFNLLPQLSLNYSDVYPCAIYPLPILRIRHAPSEKTPLKQLDETVCNADDCRSTDSQPPVNSDSADFPKDAATPGALMDATTPSVQPIDLHRALGKSLILLLHYDRYYEPISIPFSRYAVTDLFPKARAFLANRTVLLSRNNQVIGDLKRHILNVVDTLNVRVCGIKQSDLLCPSLSEECGDLANIDGPVHGILPVLCRLLRVCMHEVAVHERAGANSEAILETLKSLLVVIGSTPELISADDDECNAILRSLKGIPETELCPVLRKGGRNNKVEDLDKLPVRIRPTFKCIQHIIGISGLSSIFEGVVRILAPP